MSINYAILGLLSSQSLTGYDLKKIIQESSFLYWSGNNNQIYKALVELLNEGFVTNEVQHQDHSPSKKIYTITPAGLVELRKWVMSAPEPPEMKKTFLIQLAWSDRLEPDELSALLTAYEEEVRAQLLLLEGRSQIPFSTTSLRNEREAVLWKMIDANMQSVYRNELVWLEMLRHELKLNGKGVGVHED